MVFILYRKKDDNEVKILYEALSDQINSRIFYATQNWSEHYIPHSIIEFRIIFSNIFLYCCSDSPPDTNSTLSRETEILEELQQRNPNISLFYIQLFKNKYSPDKLQPSKTFDLHQFITSKEKLTCSSQFIKLILTINNKIEEHKTNGNNYNPRTS